MSLQMMSQMSLFHHGNRVLLYSGFSETQTQTIGRITLLSTLYSHIPNWHHINLINVKLDVNGYRRITRTSFILLISNGTTKK